MAFRQVQISCRQNLSLIARRVKDCVWKARLACKHCSGYVDRQKGSCQLADCERLTSDLICSLSTTPKIVGLEANRMPAVRRKLGFAVVQGVEQQAGLELVSNVGIGKTVDKTLDSHFFRGKSNRSHDGPPRRQMGPGSLAVPAADSSSFRRQELSEVVSNHQECHGSRDE